VHYFFYLLDVYIEKFLEVARTYVPRFVKPVQCIYNKNGLVGNKVEIRLAVMGSKRTFRPFFSHFLAEQRLGTLMLCMSIRLPTFRLWTADLT
jgi:hypothetical protein